jgi:hypothetical protein
MAVLGLKHLFVCLIFLGTSLRGRWVRMSIIFLTYGGSPLLYVAKILASGRRMGCGVLKEGVILCSGWSFTRHSSLGDVTPCIDAVVPCKGESTLVKRKQCTTGYQHVPRCAREYM